MVGKKKIENWSDRLLVWYRLRVPVVHPTPKFLKSPPPPPPSPLGQAHATRHSKRRYGPKKKKKENMALIENELLQILNVFNYTDYT